MTSFVASEWLMDKTGVSCHGGMVVAKQEMAAWAGAQVLAEGGNAMDAAVTVGWVMAVMEPYNTSIAGAGYMVYRRADGTSSAIDYSNRAPSRATPEVMSSRTSVTFSGPLSAATPGTVAGLCLALERFGTISLARAMEPAIRIAEEGMPLNWLLTLRIIQELPGIRANPHTAAIFLKDGDPGMAYNEPVIRQPDLARTLRAIAEHGTEAFYQGAIANEFISFVNEHGGILDERDFAAYEPTVDAPLRGRFRGYDLLTVPVPASGITTLESLQLLEGFDLAGMGHNSPESLHVMAEAFRLAFADRDAYLGDPDFVEPAQHALLSPEYCERRRASIDPDSAMTTVRPGDIGRVATGAAAGGGGTTHFCVMDAAGNLVSSTQTLIGGFSSIGVAGNTGVIASGALQWFDPRPNAPNSVAPGKRPLTNMCPLIVERDGSPVLAVGAPGSRRITNAVSQTVLNVLEYGMQVQPAISAPRIDCSMDYVLADDRIAQETLDTLRNLGHRVEPAREFISEGGAATGYRGNFARPAAIFVDDQGVRHGGDYPFVEGVAIGVLPD
jgi:gamma-glutamyltranspeptidase / glutathione hydrolase